MKTITKTPKKTNHILHLLLSIVSAGIWLPIWVIVALVNAFRSDVSVTERK